MQKRILAHLTNLITNAGFDVEACPMWANTGHLAICKKGDLFPVGKVFYDFQRSWNTMKFSIETKGKDVLSQPPRQGYFDFYMQQDAQSEFTAFTRVLQAQFKVMAR